MAGLVLKDDFIFGNVFFTILRFYLGGCFFSILFLDVHSGKLTQQWKIHHVYGIYQEHMGISLPRNVTLPNGRHVYHIPYIPHPTVLFFF